MHAEPFDDSGSATVLARHRSIAIVCYLQ